MNIKPRWKWRSAITGRYVKQEYAKRYPHLTVRERVTSPGFNAFCNGKPEKAKPQTLHG